MNKEQHFEYLLRLGDNALVLGHRLSEWCGHGPVLEEDIAMTNVSLDLIGQARLLYSHAGAVEGEGRDEDALAYLRDVLDWRNCLLVEQPNGDFADTMARQFLFDCWNFLVFSELTKSADEQLAAIAAKALKEISYHRRHSGEWVIRLGDGTEESSARMVDALDRVWGFTDELFEMDDVDRAALEAGVGIDLSGLKEKWLQDVTAVLAEARLSVPQVSWSVHGGRTQGMHSEHLGFLLAELQFMQRAYPGHAW